MNYRSDRLRCVLSNVIRNSVEMQWIGLRRWIAIVNSQHLGIGTARQLHLSSFVRLELTFHRFPKGYRLFHGYVAVLNCRLPTELLLLTNYNTPGERRLAAESIWKRITVWDVLSSVKDTEPIAAAWYWPSVANGTMELLCKALVLLDNAYGPVLSHDRSWYWRRPGAKPTKRANFWSLSSRCINGICWVADKPKPQNGSAPNCGKDQLTYGISGQ